MLLTNKQTAKRGEYTQLPLKVVEVCLSVCLFVYCSAYGRNKSVHKQLMEN